MIEARDVYEHGTLGLIAVLPDGTEVSLEHALRNRKLAVVDDTPAIRNAVTGEWIRGEPNGQRYPLS